MKLLSRLLPLVTFFFFLAGSRTVAQVHSPVPPDHREFLSGGAIAPDLEYRSPGPASLTKTGRTRTGRSQQPSPKTSTDQFQVGPNVQVNAPQRPFPNGLLGRSETTVVGTPDGQLLLVGFNDAQGFCGPPPACTPRRNENVGLALASDSEAYTGHLGKARELTKRAVDSAVRADDKESGAIYLANAALQQAAYGNAAEARQSAAEALKLAPASPGVAVEVTLAFVVVGDTARSESMAQDLTKRYPLGTQMQSLWLPAIQRDWRSIERTRLSPSTPCNLLPPSS